MNKKDHRDSDINHYIGRNLTYCTKEMLSDNIVQDDSIIDEYRDPILINL